MHGISARGFRYITATLAEKDAEIAALQAANTALEEALALRALTSDVDGSVASLTTAVNARALAATVASDFAVRDAAITARPLAVTVAADLATRDAAINARALAADLTAGLASRPAFILLQKLTDEPRSLTTLGDCAGLSFLAAAGAAYGFLITAIFQTAATAVGPSFAMNGPTGGMLTAYRSEIEITGGPSTAAVNVKSQTAPDVAHVTASVDMANTPRVARLQGIWRNGGTPGNVGVRFASEVAGTAITVKRGSWGIVYPLTA